MNVSLDEYFRTTFEDRLLVKMPEREEDYLTAATRLLEKRREMQEVEQALSAQKEEFQMKMESLQQRSEELARKEFQLKESLLKFDKFLKENDAKKARALKKATDEKESKRQKALEIDRLKEDTDVFNTFRDRLQRKLDEYIIHQRYLEKVIEASEDFHEIREVIDRYATLTATHKDLIARDRRNHECLEAEKQDLNKYKEEKNNEILSYNNQLAGLQTKLDKSKSAALKAESQWTLIKNKAADKTLDLGCIKMATHNLYLLVMQHQRQQLQEIDTSNTSEQLDRIQTFIQDLTHITNEIRRTDIASQPQGQTDNTSS